ncbi:MAG: hypothetical protein AAF514_08165, partial [Verrucomicrobiota bacterium]
GAGHDPALINGTGEFSMADADLFALPLFDPLADLVRLVIPEDEKVIPSRLDGAFQITDGVLALSSFHADMEKFLLNGSGEIDLTEKMVDLELSLTSDAAARSGILALLYRTFGRYICTGSLDDPKWRVAKKEKATADEEEEPRP